MAIGGVNFQKSIQKGISGTTAAFFGFIKRKDFKVANSGIDHYIFRLILQKEVK
jgi:hypothetical protein